MGKAIGTFMIVANFLVLTANIVNKNFPEEDFRKKLNVGLSFN